MCNAEGRWDGAEKAQRHREMCLYYVAAYNGLYSDDNLSIDYEDQYEAVHTNTQQLTDFLDEQIGFPLSGRPDYDNLIPLFFDKFHSLALEALNIKT